MQKIFADTILKTELAPDEGDERVYDLMPLKSRYFQFLYDPESGIEDIAVRKLRLTIYGQNGKVTLEADPTGNKYAVYDLLDKHFGFIPPPQIAITQVGLKVTFNKSFSSKRSDTCSFDISWPNSCSLKYDARSLIIRRVLTDSGIEPKIPSTVDEPIT